MKILLYDCVFFIASDWDLELASHLRHGLGGERLGVAPCFSSKKTN